MHASRPTPRASARSSGRRPTSPWPRHRRSTGTSSSVSPSSRISSGGHTAAPCSISRDGGRVARAHTGGAPRRGGAYAPVKLWAGLRSGARRASRPARLALRGTDGDRRSAQHDVPGGGHTPGKPLGQCPSLCLGRREPQGGHGSRAAGLDASGSRGGSLRPRRGLAAFDQNLNEVVGQNAKIAEYVRKLERRRPTRTSRGATFRERRASAVGGPRGGDRAVPASAAPRSFVAVCV